MPTGAFCPCTSSAMADPTAAAVPRLPRSGLPLRSGTRSRKGKVAPLPAEGKRRKGTARSVSETGWGKAASVRRGLEARDRSPAGSGGVAAGRRGLLGTRGGCPSRRPGRDPALQRLGAPQALSHGGTAAEVQVLLPVFFWKLTVERSGSSTAYPSRRGALAAPSSRPEVAMVGCVGWGWAPSRGTRCLSMAVFRLCRESQVSGDWPSVCLGLV